MNIKDLLRNMADETPQGMGVPRRMLRRAATRRLRTAVVGTLLVALVTFGGFLGVRALTRPSPVVPAAAAPCTWRTVPSLNVDAGSVSTRLNAVSVPSGSDAWAVGDAYEAVEGGDQRAIAMHWDGSTWAMSDLPQLGSSSSLLDVDAVAPDDVWAVGFEGSGSMILHWDGSTWERVPFPDPGERFVNLNAVSALASDEVWAVGGTATGDSGSTLVLHWDGEAWSIVPAPSPPPEPLVGAPYAILEDVTAVSSTDVWAVGESVNVGADPSNSLVLHWDGESWTVVPSPDRPVDGQPYSHLLAVAASGPDSAWAFGIFGSQAGTYSAGERAAAIRWKEGWGINSLPPLPDDSRLVGATAAGDTVWAVGSSGTSGSFQPLILGWDGEWELEPTDADEGDLRDVAVGPDGEGWAVGTTQEGRTLTLRCGD